MHNASKRIIKYCLINNIDTKLKKSFIDNLYLDSLNNIDKNINDLDLSILKGGANEKFRKNVEILIDVLKKQKKILKNQLIKRICNSLVNNFHLENLLRVYL